MSILRRYGHSYLNKKIFEKRVYYTYRDARNILKYYHTALRMESFFRVANAYSLSKGILGRGCVIF